VAYIETQPEYNMRTEFAESLGVSLARTNSSCYKDPGTEYILAMYLRARASQEQEEALRKKALALLKDHEKYMLSCCTPKSLIRKEYTDGLQVARAIITGASSDAAGATAGAAAGAAAGAKSAGSSSAKSAGSSSAKSAGSSSSAAGKQSDFTARLAFAQVSLKEYEKACKHFKTCKVKDGMPEYVNGDQFYCDWMQNISNACKYAGISTHSANRWQQYAAKKLDELQSRSDIVELIQQFRAQGDACKLDWEGRAGMEVEFDEHQEVVDKIALKRKRDEEEGKEEKRSDRKELGMKV
jgi:hypothetical protein